MNIPNLTTVPNYFVYGFVFLAIYQLKIFYSVVERVFVNVVNLLFCSKASPKMSSHNNPMLEFPFPVSGFYFYVLKFIMGGFYSRTNRDMPRVFITHTSFAHVLSPKRIVHFLSSAFFTLFFVSKTPTIFSGICDC